MDIIYEGAEPHVKLPYFGQQSRFFKFFYDVIKPYLNKYNTYAETNSGSNGNAFAFAKNGVNVIVNDVGKYSNYIAKAILSDEEPQVNKTESTTLQKYSTSYVKRAAFIAGLMDINGYNAVKTEHLKEEEISKIQHYEKELQNLRDENIRAYKIYNLDLFEYLKSLSKSDVNIDVMFMDFAWPWRDGSKTEEYETTANLLTDVFEKNSSPVEIWDKDNVITNVIKAVELAKKTSRYVFLSNQSSNYPTPEILEVALLSNNIKYLERHTMLTQATNEDNLMKEKYFRECLYVIKGDKE